MLNLRIAGKSLSSYYLADATQFMRVERDNLGEATREEGLRRVRRLVRRAALDLDDTSNLPTTRKMVVPLLAALGFELETGTATHVTEDLAADAVVLDQGGAPLCYVVIAPASQHTSPSTSPGWLIAAMNTNGNCCGHCSAPRRCWPARTGRPCTSAPRRQARRPPQGSPTTCRSGSARRSRPSPKGRSTTYASATSRSRTCASCSRTRSRSPTGCCLSPSPRTAGCSRSTCPPTAPPTASRTCATRCSHRARSGPTLRPTCGTR